VIVDGATLARGWLSVAVASRKVAGQPALDRTIYIEQHPEGLRLVATDAYMILRTWVPEVDSLAPEPRPEEAPIATAIAHDPHGRGRGFLAHVARLAADEDADAIDVRVLLGVVEALDPDRPTFDGMEAEWVVLEHADHERVRLESVAGVFPDWRTITGGFRGASTEAVALHPDRLAALGKLGKLHDGAPLAWWFGGADKAARIEVVQAHPPLEGLVMPVRWDLDRDAPAEDTPPAEEGDADG
jgi:hypothetical protein